MEIIDRDSIDYTVQGHSLYEIINYNEYVILRLMRQLYARDDSICGCSICVEDTFALALNSLPARYIQVTSLQTYEQSQHFIDEEEVRNKLVAAVGKVKADPKH